jgi:hypothetical protein
LLVCLLAYCAASLLHHVHNAQYLADYPNMPASLTPGTVYLAWTLEAAIGILGYFLLRAGYRLAGLALIALYAVVGFAGLDHYAIAPFSAHTLAMHFTILLEVACAALLLVAVFRERRGPAVTA